MNKYRLQYNAVALGIVGTLLVAIYTFRNTHLMLMLGAASLCIGVWTIYITSKSLSVIVTRATLNADVRTVNIYNDMILYGRQIKHT